MSEASSGLYGRTNWVRKPSGLSMYFTDPPRLVCASGIHDTTRTFRRDCNIMSDRIDNADNDSHVDHNQQTLHSVGHLAEYLTIFLATGTMPYC